MRAVSTFLLLMLPALAWAQASPDSPVPDTLYWQRYMPLEVGNVWEYAVSEGEPLLRQEIVQDTIFRGQRYYAVEEISYDYGYPVGGPDLVVWARNSFFWRYDSLGTIVTVSTLEADSSALPPGYFDLRTAFGDSITFGTSEEDYYVTLGGYNETIGIGADSVEVLARKTFQSAMWRASYAIDIGFLGGGNLWGPHLTYAKVSGREYGVSRTPTAVEQTPITQPAGIKAIYPNPAKGRITVVYQLTVPQTIRMEVFNILGQRVWTSGASTVSAGEHSQYIETTGWAVGTYFVCLAAGSGILSQQSVVLAP